MKEQPSLVQEHLQLTKITLRHLCWGDVRDANNDGQAISIKDGPHPAAAVTAPHPSKLYLRVPICGPLTHLSERSGGGSRHGDRAPPRAPLTHTIHVKLPMSTSGRSAARDGVGG